jgi:hypothetical protein
MKTNVIKIFQLIIIVIAMNACQDNSEVSPSSTNSTVNTQKIDALAERMIEPGLTLKEMEATFKEYSSLDAEEMEYYNQVQERLDIARIEEMYKNPDSELGRINKEQLETIKAEVKEITKVRKSLNDLSVRENGKSYNKLNGEEVSKLLRSIKPQVTFTRIGSDKEAKVQACSRGSYPSKVYGGVPYIFGPGKADYYQNRVDQDRDGDCDYILAFRGSYNRMSPWTTMDFVLLAALGGQTRMRYTGYTDIQIGNKIWIYGHPILASLRMY